MKKTQKFWLWVSIAMFAIPELLWSPIVNFIYIFWKGGNVPIILRDNFLMSSDYRELLIIILFVQFVGALLSAFLLYNSLPKNLYKLILISFFSILSVASLYVFVIISMASGI